MGPHTLLLGSANVLVESITLVKLTQLQRHQICSSGSAVMQHANPAKTVGYECPTLKAKGSGSQVHGGAAELGGGSAASPQPMLLVPLLQVMLQMLYESSGNLPSLLAVGSPASQRSKESSFSHRVLRGSSRLEKENGETAHIFAVWQICLKD